MGSNYIFSLTPTFTQGLILGQLSILALLVLVLKYLFLDSNTIPETFREDQHSLSFEKSHAVPKRMPMLPLAIAPDTGDPTGWFNLILQQVSLTFHPPNIKRLNRF